MFSEHPEHYYILKQSPKQNRYREWFVDLWREHLPESTIIRYRDLSEVCAEASLVINDALGTTMLDIVSVKTPLIGLLRPSHEKYYPALEKLAREAFVFARDEQEFIEKIDYYLTHLDRIPYDPDKMEKLIDSYATQKNSKEIYANFKKVLLE